MTSIEETYVKKTQRELVLLRPDTYVGATAVPSDPSEHYVYDAESRRIVRRAVRVSPALFKIFDEVLVNAADRGQHGATTIKVLFNADKASFSVVNDGPSLPLERHAKEGVYVPELVFAHMNTSSNYDDTIKRTTGGRNGLGVKLANLFSRRFALRVRRDGALYEQDFNGNMEVIGEPRIGKRQVDKKGASLPDYVSVTAWVDMSRFGFERADAPFDHDTLALLRRRVVDVAACNPHLSVWLDNEPAPVPVRSLDAYARCCLGERGVFDTNPKAKRKAKADDDTAMTTNAVAATTTTIAATAAVEAPAPATTPAATVVSAQCGERWAIAVCASRGDAAAATDAVVEGASFVNSVATSRGGTHVRFVTDRLVKALEAIAAKRATKRSLPPARGAQIRRHLCLFVAALVENPTFDAQNKECLTTQPKDFGSLPEIDDAFVKRVAKCGVLDLAGVCARTVYSAHRAHALTQSAMSRRSTSGRWPRRRAKRRQWAALASLQQPASAGAAASRACRNSTTPTRPAARAQASARSS